MVTIYAQSIINVPADLATIQEAINYARDGDTVLIAEGTYYENINFNGKAITVGSRFLIDDNEAHIENTIINGSQPNNRYRASCVYFESGEDTTSVLCGLTLTGGKGTLGGLYHDVHGGGIYAMHAAPKIINNIITNNHVTSDSYAGTAGIIVELNEGTVIIKDNIIKNNTASGNEWTTAAGIGIYSFNYKGKAKIINNKILYNKAIDSVNASGGGIEISGGSKDIYIIGNQIVGNECQSPNSYGGGINFYDCYPMVKNNLIVGNFANDGGGVSFEDVITHNVNDQELALLRYANNSIINNSASSTGGGITVIGVSPVLMNLIVWGNIAPADSQISGKANIQYSDIEGGYEGLGNIDQDPLFNDSTNYCICDASPCVDAGFPAADYYDKEDPNNSGFALYPSFGGLRNDMGCHGGGSTPTITDIAAENEVVPFEYDLSQNYPNPFNPSTIIKYSIPKKSNVTLQVFDVLGSEIVTLVEKEQTHGNYQIEFDPSKLTSGIYFYRLQVNPTNGGIGEFVATKKMILLK